MAEGEYDHRTLPLQQEIGNPLGLNILGGRRPRPVAGPQPGLPSYIQNYDREGAERTLGNNDFLNKMNMEAMRTGPSKSANLMNLESGRQGLLARDNNAQTAAGSAAKGRADLAARGGLSSGARERVEQNATNDVLNLNQKTNQQVQANRAQIGLNDEQNRIGQLQTAGQMKNQRNMFDITNTIDENKQRNAYNQNLYNQQMQLYGAERTAQAQEYAADAPSSFICSALREAGLMSLRETYLMTKFMLGAIFTRADFFAWYFSKGYEAVEVAKRQKFDFSTIKKQYVDQILDCEKEFGTVAAQSSYIIKAGMFCTQFLGECGYKSTMAEVGIAKSLLALPKVFLLPRTWRWMRGYFGAKIDRRMTKFYQRWSIL